MSLGKRDIVKNISSKTLISNKTSHKLLNNLLSIIITKSNSCVVKISNFGSFYIHQTPERLGRNPKTKELFKIPKTQKLSFKTSNSIKKILN